MKKEKNKIQSWLDKLQQESWQLELIISSILLLIIGSYDDKIPDLILKYNTNEGFNFSFIIAIAIPLLLFIKSNLIVHIFLRGLWIGCIGLRYISTDIDYNAFAYSNRFSRFLKRKIFPFDDYIEKLEKICSIIFSYSFLMVFHFLSFSIFFMIVLFLNYYVALKIDNAILENILVFIILILILSGVLNFIDFITIGKLKKTKYLSYLFYPFYRIYNTFSLAFLYRSIHYNFISNKLGRTYMLLMLPYMILLAFLGNEINFQEYIYIPKKENGSNWVIENHYDDLRKNTIIKHASIEKLFYKENEPIKLFLRVEDDEKTNSLIKNLCPEIESYNRQHYAIRPYNVFNISLNDGYHDQISTLDHASKVESSIFCISKIFEVSIDSNRIDALDYVFFQHENSGEKGILTAIDTRDLLTGKHELIIKRKLLNSDSIQVDDPIKIPFFKN